MYFLCHFLGNYLCQGKNTYTQMYINQLDFFFLRLNTHIIPQQKSLPFFTSAYTYSVISQERYPGVFRVAEPPFPCPLYMASALLQYIWTRGMLYGFNKGIIMDVKRHILCLLIRQMLVILIYVSNNEFGFLKVRIVSGIVPEHYLSFQLPC